MPLVLTADTNPGTASFSAFDGSIQATGSATVNAQTLVVSIPGVAATDLVFAQIQSNDTGGSLVSVLTAGAGSDQITLGFGAAPTNNDGVVNYLVVRPD